MLCVLMQKPGLVQVLDPWFPRPDFERLTQLHTVELSLLLDLY